MNIYRKRNCFLLLVLTLCLFTALVFPAIRAHASDIPEHEEVQEGNRYVEAVIHVRAEKGTEVKIEADPGSPGPDGKTFACTGDREKDVIRIRISEPGDYSYQLTVGRNKYFVRICGIYEDSESGEVLAAKTVILREDGSKTDEPYDEKPPVPFGIADSDAAPFMMMLSGVAALTVFGVFLILRRKEETA